MDLLVIETDGSWEQADSLKTAFRRCARRPAWTCFPIRSMRRRHVSRCSYPAGGNRGTVHGLPGMPVGAGLRWRLYAHRYKSANGFDNPSVYCADLKVLIPKITARPMTGAASQMRRRLRLRPLISCRKGPLTCSPRARVTPRRWRRWRRPAGR